MREPDSEYITRWLGKEEYEQWDNFVLAQSEGTVFHTTSWLEPLNRHELQIIAVFRDGKICAGAAMIIRPLAGARILIQPPLTPYSGPVFGDVFRAGGIPETVANAIKQAFSALSAYRFSLPPQAQQGVDLFKHERTEPWRRTNRLSAAPESFDDLRMHISGSLRRNIRKAEKNALKTEQTDDIETVYRLSEASYEASGREHPLEFSTFRKLHHRLAERGLVEARIAFTSDGKATAAAWTPFDATYAYNVIHGLDRRYRALQGGPYVLYKSIEAFRERGISFDFEGSMKERIHRFYQKFNTEVCPFGHYHQNRSGLLKLLNRLNIIHV